MIGGRETTVMESAVFSAAAGLRADGQFATATATMRAISPDAREFVARFQRASVSRIATIRYLLKEVEHAKRHTHELAVEAPDRVHVEHIYPQNPDTDRWPGHAQVVNRVGNLILLSKHLNTSIKNGGFTARKERGYTGSDILLTKELLPREIWDFEAIEERQRELAEWAFGIWNFPGEHPPAIPVPDVSIAEPIAFDELPEVPS